MDEGTLDGTDDSSAPALPCAGLETLVTDGPDPGDEFVDERGEGSQREGPGAGQLGDDPIHIGRFVVLRRVGQGGMGVVYAAYDNELDRRLAIKLVHVARARGDSRARVRREAQAMARLSHPNVVQVYEVGEHEQQVFVAMEFITGPTLGEWARDLPPGPERWRAILDRYIDVGRGLAAAHDAHIVHRDFKPANAIVGDDGRVRVLDFGIARAPEGVVAAAGDGSAGPPELPRPADVRAALELAQVSAQPDGEAPTLTAPGFGLGSSSRTETRDPLSTPLTLTGAMIGTPAYMSPEQFERRPVDPRSDQFSFCVALHEALYGERPFRGDTPAALVFSVLNGEMKPAPAHAEVPGWVREIVMRGLATSPDARWASMAELLDALGRDPARRRRRQLRRLASVSLVLLAMLSSGWYARGQMRSADEAEAARIEAQREEALAQAREAEAEAARDRALIEAQASAVRARDTARVLGARGLDSDPDLAAALLRDVEHPAATPGWRSVTVNVLQQPLSEAVHRDHEDRIAYLDVARGGGWYASASFDGTARLWSSEGGPATVLRHEDAVRSVSFSRQADRVVTASRDQTAAVWELPERPGDRARPPLVLRGHEDMLWSASFSFDGTKVVTASRDGTVRVWDLDEPERPAIVYEQGHAPVWWAEFSPDGRWIVTAAGDGKTIGEAAVWSVDEPERPPIWLAGHTARVGDAHFDSSMRLIATASSDGRGRLFRFDPSKPGPIEAHAILGHDSDVYRVRFSPAGLRVVTVSRDRRAKLWTLDDAGGIAGEPMVFESDAGVVWSPDISPDGRLLALGIGGGGVQIRPIEGGPMLSLVGHTSDVFRVRFSDDGSRLYTGSSDGSVRVWNTDWHGVARQLRGHVDDVTAIEGRGRVLVSGARDGTVRVWPVFDPGPAPAVTAAPAVLGGHHGHVILSLDDQPRLLATADEAADHLRLWRITGTWVLEPERPLLTLRTNGVAVRSLDLDGVGELLVATLVDSTVLLWRLGSNPAEASPEPIHLARHATSLESMTVARFSPDGATLASAGGDGLIRLWERAALLNLDADAEPPTSTVLAGHTQRIYRLSFAADGRRLASVSTDHSARVWDLDHPEAEPQVLEHGYFVNTSSFDPSGRWLVTACSDANAYLWDLDNPDTPTLLSGAAGEIRDVEFSPDGRLIGAVSIDGRLRIWPLEGGEPVELDAGVALAELEFVDEGRRVAVAGLGPDVPLWYLGPDLGTDALHERLLRASKLCLSPEQRMKFVGESREIATQSSAACSLGRGPK